jgi:hypothetical protein
MRKQAAVWAVAIVAGALTLAACGSSSPSSTTTTTASTGSTTAIAPAAALATGTYAPTGSSGTPHYAVEISKADGTAFSGTMSFVYQDGKTSRVFDFSGTVSGQSATATATNEASAGATPKIVSAPVPSPLAITVGSDTLTFEGCQSYLPQAPSASACTFSQSR